ncbi:SDR family NAD(P)-dependent oxidoreductase [Lentzea sp. NPDC004789]
MRDYLKRVTTDLQRTRRELHDADAAAHEPIAIIGIGSRFPGDAHGPDALWELVRDGRDAITEFPSDRGWDLDRLTGTGEPGTTYVTRGGFLHDAALFDAEFFGISPREAEAAEPQQRLLLETAWEALEDARIDPSSVRGRAGGVFVGVIAQEYATRPGETPQELEGFLLTGSTTSVASGRLAYTFGLEGPAITVDTACSSSLVAIHLAVQSLRRGESEFALAGGATVMASPSLFIEFSRQQGLSPDGRCRSMAAGADGTGFAEGVGVLVLERLSDAERHGHRVLAVIRGSAVNQDGASNGLTAPNGPSQERVIRAALADARLSTSDVDAVEAHGTGTTLGDPIEAQALLATYGQGRTEPLRLSSIKSNIGHTQAAAGVAGVIKMVQAMRHGTFPVSLHVDEPTPEVDWSAGAVTLSASAEPWPAGERPRRAGVSSFGVSGTNAHVILEQAPAPEPVTAPGATGIVPWVLSAATEQALGVLASRLSEVEGEAAAVAWSLATTRAALDQRAVVLGETREELVRGLTDLAAGVPSARVVTGAVTPGGLAFLFSGQGSQRVGMGRELYASQPVFAAAFDEVCAELDKHLDQPLKTVVFDDENLLNQTACTQPALFALETALYRLLAHHGVQPDYLIGHSIGELTAAHVAGVLSLADAALLVCTRARLMQALPAGGAMIALQAGESEVLEWLVPGADIAGLNSADNTVVSGDEDAVLAVAKNANGRKATRLQVSHAFHSAHLDPMLAELTAVAETLTHHPPQIPIISNLTGTVIDSYTPGYWARQARSAVRYLDGVTTLTSLGVTTALEIGPDSTLSGITTGGIPSLRRRQPEHLTFATALARLHVRGVAVDWRLTETQPVDLPTYPFQRERYWLRRPAGGDPASLGLTGHDHPLLTAVVRPADTDTLLLTGGLSLATHPWLAGHTIGGTVLLPGTALLDLAITAGDAAGCATVGELTVEQPLVVPATGTVRLQVGVGAPDDNGTREFSVHARLDGEDWTRHATGTLETTPRAADHLTWPPEGEPVALEGFYDSLAALGYHYGPAFRGLTAAWRDGTTVHAEVELPAEHHREAHGIHPALLDAALHTLALSTVDAPEGVVRLPFSWEGSTLHATGATRLRVRLTTTGPDTVSLLAADDTGAPVASIESLTLRTIRADAIRTRRGERPYELEWVPVALAEPDAPTPVVIELRGDSGSVVDATHRLAATTLRLLQDHLAGEGRAVFLTRSAVAAVPGDTVTDLAAASVRGLVRTAASEHPGRVVLIDTDDHEDSADLIASAAATGESELVLRKGEALRPQLARARQDVLVPPDAPNWRIDATGTGTLDGLTLAPAEQQPLGEGQVRIAVRAAGLNFRDVLIALGVYPGAAVMGSEGAGVVVEIGPGVTDLAVGEKVMGLLAGGAGPTSVTDRALVTRMPHGWSFTQAASVPIVFLTAYYSLVDLGRVQPGESVLVHAAAGGVGMAAVQLARHLKAEVYGTASPGKWSVLRGLGLTRIAGSRTLEFERQFLDATGGEGVDVVLDALAGEFVDASLRLLPRGGRFLEMGKTDIREAAVVAAEHPGVDYRAFDLMEAGPQRIQEMLGELVTLFERGVLTPLPITTWDLRRAPEAFRFLGQARHIGKIVLTVPRHGDGTVLITGGTGALGARVARHLVRDRGVRDLLLLSRSGRADDLVEELTGLGARVRVTACDVADRAALAEVLAPERLAAVVHAAGVLDDVPLTGLTPQRLADVLRPKVDAAWHLHELAGDVPSFVLFSSIAGLAGNAGQAAYAAANSFLDALARHRAELGLAATSLAWGPWATGMAAGQRWEHRAVRALSDAEGLALFDAADSGSPLVVPVKIDPAARDAAERPLLRGLRTAPARRAAVRDALALDQLSGAERQRALVDLVRAQAALVLGHSGAEAIAPARTFTALGFDSLTAVELRNRLNDATGLRLSTSLIFDHPTPQDLAGYLEGELGGAAQTGSAVTTTASSDDPVVIVGMACRYPGGVASPEDLWRLVTDGTDAIGEFPVNRDWDVEDLFADDPDAPGRSYVRTGGFVHDADTFDPAFFGINPREATALDPQQRLLLETSWEAVERAGIDPRRLAGTATGVFAGVIAGDYASRLAKVPDDVEGYLSTGNTTSVASGRVSYTLGLRGPAITVDTACSSSLVAIHLAAQALRRGECDLALAGGVTIMASPANFVEFSRQRALSPDGRCKAFSATADGTGWGEGAGMLLLARLSDAVRDGREVLAVLRGSAVNQDGASNGLTAPNGPSQQRVIRAALADGGLSTSDVDVVEAHGTGTALGDPIEAQALLSTYGQDRAEPLWLGSIKSNIGHTLAAAGVAGVIKMVQALRHRELPRTLHVTDPTSGVDWSAGAVSLLTEARPWPDRDRPRRAGVSSFGISGTNAHVIVEQGPAPATTEPRPHDGPVPVVLSGRGGGALRDQAARVRELVAAGTDLADLAHSLVTTRSAFEDRAAVVAASREELLSGLDALIADRQAAHLVRGRAGDDSGVVFVFPGQGSQWAGMAVELAEHSPVFAERLGECAAALSSYVDWSLPEALRGESLDRVDVVQPALFAVMVSLAALWRSFGVEPSAVVGHSQGEIAAACVAGALTLDDAARIVALRSQIIARRMAGAGGMGSVPLPAAEVAERLRPWQGRLVVAAHNGPSSTVISGDADALTEFLAANDDVRARRIQVDYASHSAHVDGIRDELLAALAGLTPRRTSITFHSTVTGEPVDGTELDADYWFRNLREPVRLEPVITRLAGQGNGVFVECSPHPVLAVGVGETLEAAGAPAGAVGSLRRDDGGLDRFLLSAAQAHALGAPLELDGLLGRRRLIALPTYPFQRSRFWLESAAVPVSAAGLGLTPSTHPLLGASVSLPGDGGAVFTAVLSTRTHPWLADHALAGAVLLPGAGLVELVRHAGAETGCPAVAELTLEAPLVLTETPVRVQVTVGADESGRRTVEVHTVGDTWVRHATGAVTTAGAVPTGFSRPSDAEPVDLTGRYEALRELGYEYGPAFRGLRALARSGTDLHAEVSVPAEPGYGVHPALLDACLHAMVPAESSASVRVPFEWRDVQVHRAAATSLRVRLTPVEGDAVALHAVDESGATVLTVGSIAVRPMPASALMALRAGDRGLFTLRWQPAAPATGTAEVSPFGEDVLGLGLSTSDEPDWFALTVAGPDVHGECGRVLAALQAWLTDERYENTRLAVVTRGAVAAVATDTVPDLAGAAVHGLVRTAQSEHPDRIVLVDLDDTTSLTAALTAGEPQVAVRGGRVLVPRLVRDTAEPVPFDFDPDGTVLVTGASGTLAGLVARHLVTAHGVRRLLLASRTPATELAAALTELGARVRAEACDVSDREAVRELVAGARDLTAVIHLAGALDDATITALTPRQLGTALRPKADGAWHLHELTENLKAFVLFSSAAGVLGNAGQGAYAAANAFLDGLAAHRRAAGLPASSLAWGLWARTSGMTDGVDAARLSGARAMSDEEGLELFDRALRENPVGAIAAALDPAALRAAFTPLFAALVKAPAKAEPAVLLPEGLSDEERHAAVLTLVRGTVAAVLGHRDDEAIEPDRPFKELGFDSLTAVELRNRLTSATGLRLPATMVFDHPTPAAVAARIAGALAPAPRQGPDAAGLLAELDRFEAGLAELSEQDGGRALITRRLHRLLAGLGTEPEGGDDFADRLGAASASDILDLIDQEFGSPA